MQLNELKDELQPLIQMVKEGKIPPGKVSAFLTKFPAVNMPPDWILKAIFCNNASNYEVTRRDEPTDSEHQLLRRIVSMACL